MTAFGKSWRRESVGRNFWRTGVFPKRSPPLSPTRAPETLPNSGGVLVLAKSKKWLLP
jgi:hypothetical protein